MVLLTILLYALLLMFPLGAVIRIPVIGSSYIYPIDIVAAIIFFEVIFFYIKKKENVFKNTVTRRFAYFIIFSFIALLLNITWLSPVDFLISGLYLLRIVIYLSITFALITRFDDPKYKIFLVLSGFCTVILGFIQYFFYQNLRNLYYLGWDDHLYRLFSTFLDPNFAGAIFVFELLLLLALFFTYYHKSRVYTLAITVGIFLTLIALFLTYSRSALLMLVISAFVFFILLKKIKWILFLLTVGFIAVLIIPKDFHIENMNLFRTASVKGRLDAYEHAFFLYQKSPLYGIGFNSYRFAQRKYNLLDAKWEITHAGAGVSNSYLFVLVTTGIIGLALFLSFWYQLLKKLYNQFKNDTKLVRKKEKIITENSFLAAGIASIIGVGVHSFTENTVFYPFIMIWISIIIGLMLTKKQPGKN